MLTWFRAASLAVTAAGFMAAGAPGANAQLAGDPAAAAASPAGWSFNVTPYLWISRLKVDVDYNIPAVSARLPTTFEVGAGEIYNNLRFGGTFAADARY